MYIRKLLESMAQKSHQDFMSNLLPNIEKEKILGLKNPDLKKLAKELEKTRPSDIEVFLDDLPHKYQEENMLHAFIVSNIKDFDKCVDELEKFSPFIDNWAVCDSFRPKTFAKNLDKLNPYIQKWIISDEEYTKRLAMGLLLSYYLKDDFEPVHLDWVSVNNDERYYVKMMVAWYFSMALAKKYPETIGYIEHRVLEKWTHNKTIQKAIESRQVSEDHKSYLRSLKIK